MVDISFNFIVVFVLQETRVCERIDEVDCSKSEQFYNLNLELYGNTQAPILEGKKLCKKKRKNWICHTILNSFLIGHMYYTILHSHTHIHANTAEVQIEMAVDDRGILIRVMLLVFWRKPWWCNLWPIFNNKTTSNNYYHQSISTAIKTVNAMRKRYFENVKCNWTFP